MLPSFIQCEACLQRYHFPDYASRIYLYAKEYDHKNALVRDDSLIAIPKKPIWCGVCNKPTFAEDLREIRDWEGAFALIKAGNSVEFPIDNTCLDDKLSVIEEFKKLFEIRLMRQDKGRCLFCGGLQYIEIGNPDTGIRHDGCGGRFIRLYSISSSIYMFSAYKVYTINGIQIGKLKKHGDINGTFVLNECGYDVKS